MAIRLIIYLLFNSIILFSTSIQAELIIRITKGMDHPTLISIVPFKYIGSVPLTEDIAKIVSDDLRYSGQFTTIEPHNMLSFPSLPEEVKFRDWRLLSSEYLVIGTITQNNLGYQVVFSLFDIISQKAVLFNQLFIIVANELRDMAHAISDLVYENIIGIRGAFSTDIIYVEHRKSVMEYRLIRADMDGERPRVLFKSDKPILSPSWSPDGKYVAYVSFESNHPAIYIQDLLTGKRRKLTNFPGLNNAPAWSPNGEELALVLSKDGNPEIYTLNLDTKQLTRITTHFAIDTEPTWTPDSTGIVFTSNRGGKPQIYRVLLAEGYPERLTFEGEYNARARVTPDGKAIIMVHQRDKVFHVALQELNTGRVRLLTTATDLDESPSISPNGMSIIYATKSAGRGILASVSLNMRTRFILPSTLGDVREPAWSPF